MSGGIGGGLCCPEQTIAWSLLLAGGFSQSSGTEWTLGASRAEEQGGTVAARFLVR